MQSFVRLSTSPLHWAHEQCTSSVRCETLGRAGAPRYTALPDQYAPDARTSVRCYRKQHFCLRFFTSGAVENRRFTSRKALNPASQARREEERNPNPSLPLKLHRFRKCANITKYTSPCACVLPFSQSFLRRYISSPLDPNAYDQRITPRGTCRTQLQREFPSL
jgi:hypothetical protein